jgi:ubiquinone/menaquinone biosynthesis C-methylase UbiE
MSTLDMSTPYSPIFAAFYDFFIAPAVTPVALGDLRRFLEHVRSGERVLDVGCGGGQHPVLIARERPDVRIVGLDLSTVFLERARRRARKAGVENRVELVHGNAIELPFAANSFDHVYSFGSIKHWGDLALGLSECLRVLAPGGQLLVSEADRGCRFEDAATWAANTRFVKPLQHLIHAYFRTIVTGQSIDLVEAEALWAKMELVDKQPPRRIPGTPAMVMSGRKPAR